MSTPVEISEVRLLDAEAHSDRAREARSAATQVAAAVATGAPAECTVQAGVADGATQRREGEATEASWRLAPLLDFVGAVEPLADGMLRAGGYTQRVVEASEKFLPTSANDMSYGSSLYASGQRLPNSGWLRTAVSAS